MSEETVWQGLAAILPIFHWTVLALNDGWAAVSSMTDSATDIEVRLRAGERATAGSQWGFVGWS